MSAPAWRRRQLHFRGIKQSERFALTLCRQFCQSLSASGFSAAFGVVAVDAAGRSLRFIVAVITADKRKRGEQRKEGAAKQAVSSFVPGPWACWSSSG